MSGSRWASELWRLGLGLGLGALFAQLLFRHAGYGVLAGLLLYLGWHLYNLRRLERWLRDGRKLQPPDAAGIWGEVFHHLYLLQKRNRNRKRKLKNYLKRFRESTDATPDATVVLDRDGAIEWWNGAAARVIGLRSPDDHGQRIVNLMRHPDFVQFLTSEDYSGTVELPSPVDDSLQLSIRVVPFGNKQRLLVARDVTRLQRLEQVRRDFVANVSHELKTPLTVISGFLETMEEGDESLQRRWGRSLKLMRQQTQRMQRLVEDLLLLSRLETGARAGKPEPVKVATMLAEIANDARALSGERGHQLRLEADAEVGLNGFERELRSAFSNLVFNAVQYTPAGGRIELRWWRDEQGAHFQVRDSGEGIAPQHLPRLTERFYRVDVGRSRDSGGTGLGLAIVKHVLNHHGATLRVESELGKGSVFTCDFPGEGLV